MGYLKIFYHFLWCYFFIVTRVFNRIFRDFGYMLQHNNTNINEKNFLLKDILLFTNFKLLFYKPMQKNNNYYKNPLNINPKTFFTNLYYTTINYIKLTY